MYVSVMAAVAAAAIDVHRRCRQIARNFREIKRLRRELREPTERDEALRDG